ncbi:alpha-hydroxy-acid oxidizing protein [Paraburkholderia sp. C35]|uniref:alpha-hydroxy-acid oxidizing protein n=1 Tax=Paraburkholderia sp. C35 TaxID=2126993 RepID=UPI000D69F7FB|nr:alpha-hydroxy-acid oxidizing protein [Paraburkholderia sp. C35]
MSKPVNVADFRALAKNRLPKMVFDYLEGGAEDESGIRRNVNAFREVLFQPHRLVDVSVRDVTTTFFGKRQRLPLVIAPTGLNGIFWPDGDLALARAASRFGIPFALSTASTASIEQVARECDGELWFQLYVVHRKLASQLVRRAMDSGYTTLILTTDVGVNGKRERDMRNGFGFPLKYSLRTVFEGAIHPRWTADLLRHGIPQLANFADEQMQDTEIQAALMSRQMDASFSFDDLAWLRRLWPHKLLIKGLSRPADAERCIALGADGVILSNHGGRQLESAIAPLQTLQETASKLVAPVLLDSGVRRGSDVVKAVALGARAVLLGRATLYGLAAQGQEGVEAVLAILKDEIDRTLAQIGCASLSGLTSDYIWESGRKLPAREGNVVCLNGVNCVA